MQIIKHRRAGRALWFYSIVGVDLCRLHAVAARLDLLPHRFTRVYRRAVWLSDRGIWQIAYKGENCRFQDFDVFERQYAMARRAVQYAEFPGFKYTKVSRMFARSISEPNTRYTLAESPYFKAGK